MPPVVAIDRTLLLVLLLSLFIIIIINKRHNVKMQDENVLFLSVALVHSHYNRFCHCTQFVTVNVLIPSCTFYLIKKIEVQESIHLQNLTAGSDCVKQLQTVHLSQ